jgi:large subunit ribosomal protein L22
MEVVATAKWVRTTARKARLVTATVEGLPVAEALVILRFTPRAAAHDVANVIKSAAANAEHNYNLDVSTLRVARVEVESAAIIKRFRPKPRGVAGSIFKRTAHLRAFVTDDEPTPQKRVRSKIRMPRTVVTAPTAGPSRETPASRRRRSTAASASASAAVAAAASTTPVTPSAEGTTPRRRRGAPKPDDTTAQPAATAETSGTAAAPVEETAPRPDAADTENTPVSDAGEGDTT